MNGIDTNVLVRYLTQDDVKQARTVDALIAATIEEGSRLRVDDIVLCELVWVLRGPYRLGDLADHLIGRRNARAGCESTMTFDKALEGSAALTRL